MASRNVGCFLRLVIVKNTFSLVFLQSVKEGSRGKPSAQEL